MTKIVAISDTHNLHRYIENIPDGDVLIHSGDSTMGGSPGEIQGFVNWFKDQPHKHKVMVPGNHDLGFEGRTSKQFIEFVRDSGITYLQDEAIEINGLRFWGAPWSPRFHDWAFNVDRGDAIAAKWSLIPKDTNVLITHGPPSGILDHARGIPLGCEALRYKVEQLKDLKCHIFGHIHEGYGMLERNGVVFMNAATCTGRYAPSNRPLTIEL